MQTDIIYIFKENLYVNKNSVLLHVLVNGRGAVSSLLILSESIELLRECMVHSRGGLGVML